MKSFKDRLPTKLNSLFHILADVANAQGIEAYLVGGFVRDLVLEKENEDIDIVVSNSGGTFSKTVARHLKSQIDKRSQFGTYSIPLPEEGIQLDIATARSESYASPSVLPNVAPGDLKADLFRRDFTINSLALSLNASSAFTLIDYFGGYEDLGNGIIRAHHENSFIDDPCRIFRALRFQTRFKFRLEAKTQAWLKNSIAQRIPELLSGHRLWNEIQRTLQENDLFENFKILNEYSLLPLLNTNIESLSQRSDFLKNIALLHTWVQDRDSEACIEKWIVHCLALVTPLTGEEIEALAQKCQWSNSLKDKILSGHSAIQSALPELMNECEKSPNEIFELFHPLSPEALVVALAQSDTPKAKHDAELYLKKIRQTGRIELNGDDLIRLGISPGPMFKNIFSALRQARLDEQIFSRAEEESFVKKNFM
jgi:tRNA nucleotidyltransferase (CCA-adding enzyme)